MDSSKVFLAKSLLQVLIKDMDLLNPFHGEQVFVGLVWENLPEELAKYAICLLGRQQLLQRIHYQQEHTMKYGR